VKRASQAERLERRTQDEAELPGLSGEAGMERRDPPDGHRSFDFRIASTQDSLVFVIQSTLVLSLYWV
jgi:hypothetical protein